MLEWSKTVKKRSQKRPAEQTGDFDDQVQLSSALIRSAKHVICS